MVAIDIFTSKKLEDIERILFTVSFKLHFESKVGISMQPASLIDILGSYSDKPMLSMSQIRAKLHNHVSELV